MRFENELAVAFNSCGSFHTFEKYAELLSPQLIQQGFEQAGVATIRKRRLPLETVLWSIIGMSLYHQKSVWVIATQMDIMLPDKKPLVAPSALVKARKKFTDLPEYVEARLVTKTIKGKTYRMLSSMVDPMRFPGDEIVEFGMYKLNLSKDDIIGEYFDKSFALFEIIHSDIINECVY